MSLIECVERTSDGHMVCSFTYSFLVLISIGLVILILTSLLFGVVSGIWCSCCFSVYNRCMNGNKYRKLVDEGTIQ